MSGDFIHPSGGDFSSPKTPWLLLALSSTCSESSPQCFPDFDNFPGPLTCLQNKRLIHFYAVYIYIHMYIIHVSDIKWVIGTTYVYTDLYLNIHVYIYIYIHIFLHTYIYYICVYSYIYIYIYLFINFLVIQLFIY